MTVPPTTVPTHELTNAEQQHALDTLTDARARGRASDTRAAEHQVIQTHLSFAAALARRCHGRGVDSEDLLQLARLGLVKAVKRWDPGTGAAFIPYTYPTILGELNGTSGTTAPSSGRPAVCGSCTAKPNCSPPTWSNGWADRPPTRN